MPHGTGCPGSVTAAPTKKEMIMDQKTVTMYDGKFLPSTSIPDTAECIAAGSLLGKQHALKKNTAALFIKYGRKVYGCCNLGMYVPAGSELVRDRHGRVCGVPAAPGGSRVIDDIKACARRLFEAEFGDNPLCTYIDIRGWGVHVTLKPAGSIDHLPSRGFASAEEFLEKLHRVTGHRRIPEVIGLYKLDYWVLGSRHVDLFYELCDEARTRRLFEDVFGDRIDTMVVTSSGVTVDLTRAANHGQAPERIGRFTLDSWRAPGCGVTVSRSGMPWPMSGRHRNTLWYVADE